MIREPIAQSDAAFVKQAKEAWLRVLAMQDEKPASLSIAVALWATMNADRLIAIAERDT